MKNNKIIIFIFLFFISLFFSACNLSVFNSKKEEKNILENQNKIDQINLKEKEEAQAELQQLFIDKYPKYQKTLQVRIDKFEANFARGGVIFVEKMPGIIFLATKIENNWEIVFAGNGQIDCTLSKYNFPDYMLSDCAK